MGEYINYKGTHVKIGTLENLYYVSFPKYFDALNKGALTSLSDGGAKEYIQPEEGFRYRFPFPDEDDLPFGDIIGRHDRGIPVTIEYAAIPTDGHPENIGPTYEIEITQQVLKYRESDKMECLALVYRDPILDMKFRIEDTETVNAIVDQIKKNHIINENDIDKKILYGQVVDRILKGYQLDVLKAELEPKNSIGSNFKKKKATDDIIGRIVMIDPNMVKDPLKKHGEVGEITAITFPDKAIVQFGDGIKGEYKTDKLLTLNPGPVILQALISNGDMALHDYRAIMKIYQLVIQKKNVEALYLAGSSKSEAFFCTSTIPEWQNMQREKRKKQRNDLKL